MIDRRLMILSAGEIPQRPGRWGQFHTFKIDGPFGGRLTAGAVFELRGGEWVCVDAVPAIDWMVGRRGADVKRIIELPRQRWNGWRYRWASRWELSS